MTLYKILTRAQLDESRECLSWSAVDRRDGFVHLSDASQVRETARRHFAGQPDLVLIELDAERLAPGTLRWEPSRGGALFPHVHGDVPLEAILAVHDLVEGTSGFVLPVEIP
ncbi:MAG: DUF952 domain-containing protein [Sandaracinaceae bacterium]|nr:DUF952 domain-containing protein [Sandaracinaceae bacterium]